MKFRKFNLTDTEKGVYIPNAALTVSGFNKGERMEGHALEGAVVLLKKEMNASDLIRTAEALMELMTSLSIHLNDACVRCQDCSEVCPYGPEDYAIDIDLPDELREAAGIPLDVKLQAEFGDGLAVIHADDGMPGLRDVPPYIMDAFLSLGGCPEDLENHILQGDIIYGGD